MQSIVDSILDKCDGHLLAVDMLGKALRRYKTAKGWQDVAKKFHEGLQTGASHETNRPHCSNRVKPMPTEHTSHQGPTGMCLIVLPITGPLVTMPSWTECRLSLRVCIPVVHV